MKLECAPKAPKARGTRQIAGIMVGCHEPNVGLREHHVVVSRLGKTRTIPHRAQFSSYYGTVTLRGNGELATSNASKQLPKGFQFCVHSCFDKHSIFVRQFSGRQTALKCKKTECQNGVVVASGLVGQWYLYPPLPLMMILWTTPRSRRW